LSVEDESKSQDSTGAASRAAAVRHRPTARELDALFTASLRMPCGPMSRVPPIFRTWPGNLEFEATRSSAPSR